MCRFNLNDASAFTNKSEIEIMIIHWFQYSTTQNYHACSFLRVEHLFLSSANWPSKYVKLKLLAFSFSDSHTFAAMHFSIHSNSRDKHFPYLFIVFLSYFHNLLVQPGLLGIVFHATSCGNVCWYDNKTSHWVCVLEFLWKGNFHESLTIQL